MATAAQYGVGKPLTDSGGEATQQHKIFEERGTLMTVKTNTKAGDGNGSAVWGG